MNYCYKHKIHVATNGVVITDAIKIFRAPVFVLLTICILSISIITNSLHVADAQQRISIVATGDWGCNSDTKNTVNNIIAKKPSLVLALGDYSYQPTTKCWLNAIKPIDKVTKINIGNHENAPKYGLGQYMKHFGLSSNTILSI